MYFSNKGKNDKKWCKSTILQGKISSWLNPVFDFLQNLDIFDFFWEREREKEREKEKESVVVKENQEKIPAYVGRKKQEKSGHIVLFLCLVPAKPHWLCLKPLLCSMYPSNQELSCQPNRVETRSFPLTWHQLGLCLFCTYYAFLPSWTGDSPLRIIKDWCKNHPSSMREIPVEEIFIPSLFLSFFVLQIWKVN